MKETFNDLTLDELISKKAELTKRMHDIRFEMVLGHLENPMEKRIVRKNIARLNTLINEVNSGKRKA
ncbi:MAG: 50S ribosomal protein L29 [Spirochaetales bacterium]|nr:50S ribosomal protein L29 [Spirochaetales bacterium]